MGIRVLVVDDTVTYRRAISDALAGLPGVEVAGTAANGKLALSRMAALQPDLITLDIEMPDMNGIEVLEAMGPAGLKAGVIVLSSLTVRGGEMTVRALELGAFDFLTKPEGGNGSPGQNLSLLRDRLRPVIQAFERKREIRAMLRPPSSRPVPADASILPAAPISLLVERPVRRLSRTGSPLVLIGVSTGGPAGRPDRTWQARQLGRVLPALPGDLGSPVLIVQHMPALFTQPLAASLGKKSAIRVKEAEEGEPAVPGCAYLAPGGRHMKLVPGPKGEVIIRLSDDPPENGCRPAVDYLFRSAALHFPGRSIAAILTGMGNDGTAGLRLLKRSGCVSIAQDEASCVVFGMPKEAIAAGVVDTIAPLESIAGAIVRSVRGGNA